MDSHGGYDKLQLASLHTSSKNITLPWAKHIKHYSITIYCNNQKSIFNSSTRLTLENRRAPRIMTHNLRDAYPPVTKVSLLDRPWNGSPKSFAVNHTLLGFPIQKQRGKAPAIYRKNYQETQQLILCFESFGVW